MRSHRPWLPLLALLAGLALTFGFWNQSRAVHSRTLSSALERHSQEAQVRIETRLRSYERSLLAARSHFQASPSVTRKSFATFVAGLDLEPGMQAIGFAPNVTGFGLEAAGVALTDRGAIAIDDYMRTNVPNIFAIGDVTAKLQLAHVAEAMGVVAAETIGGAETLALGDYRMMPRATFCQPQVASFGLTEEQAKYLASWDQGT